MNKTELVKNYIINKINKKIYSAGQMIESESDLCNKLNISRMTVRKALNELVSEGIIFKEKGRGTFVAAKPKYAEFQCGIAFTKEVVKRNMIPSTKNATLELTKADELIAHKLKISVGDPVWKITRVRCADNIPVIYACEYYNYYQCEDLTLDIIYHSIYEHLEKKGISFAFCDQSMEAVSCPEQIANQLEIEANHPVILMSLIAYMQNGIPFNFGYEYYRTDKLRLVQSIYNRENTQRYV